MDFIFALVFQVFGNVDFVAHFHLSMFSFFNSAVSLLAVFVNYFT